MALRRTAAASVKGGLYFLAVGPPAGALAVTLLGAAKMLWNSGFGLMVLLEILGFGLLALMFSWPFGALPALLAGLALGPMRPRFRQWRWCLFAGIVSAATASIGLLVGPFSDDLGSASPIAMLVYPGFIGGIVAARVFGQRAVVPPPLPQAAGIGDSP